VDKDGQVPDDQQVKGKGKGKAREVVLSEEQPDAGEDKMDVDPVETGETAAAVDEEPAPGASTTTTRKTSGPTKPALKRKASDRGERERGGTTARSTPGPGNAPVAGTTGMMSARAREERMRAVPRGELIRHLYKGLMWDEVEKHAHYGWTDVSCTGTLLFRMDLWLIPYSCRRPHHVSPHSPS